MSSSKSPSLVEHTVEFPCELRAKVDLEGDPRQQRVLDVTINTQTCYECRYKCQNPDGHKSKIRTGGRNNKHVTIQCTARVVPRIEPAIEAHVVKAFAKKHWPKMTNVYYLEPSVYEVIGEDNDVIGHVYFSGADVKWMSVPKAKFMRS